MPDEHAVVLLPDGKHPQPQRAVGSVRLVGNVSIDSVRAPAPPVERALHAVADHLATVADVSTEVFTVRLQHVQFTVLIPVRHQIVAEIVQRTDLGDRKLRRPTDHEPPSDFPGERDQHGDASCNPLILNSLQYRFQVEEA